MSRTMTVTYYYHSGFSVASDDVLLVFDYWQGKTHRLPENVQITPETLARFRQVYVFISHEHADHYDLVVYDWQQYSPVTYIIADDMPADVEGRRIGPGGELFLNERVQVKAYGSTDAGVSFLVTLDGAKYFHAGDLNFWHWREVSTARQIEEADEDFRGEVSKIIGEEIDVAFFPVDPRMGYHFDAGANYFMMAVKPRLLLPMHFWRRNEVIVEFARRSRSRETEIVPLTINGQGISITYTDDGYMTIDMLQPPVQPREEAASGNEVSLAGYEGQDPFHETDLPVDLE